MKSTVYTSVVFFLLTFSATSIKAQSTTTLVNQIAVDTLTVSAPIPTYNYQTAVYDNSTGLYAAIGIYAGQLESEAGVIHVDTSGNFAWEEVYTYNTQQLNYITNLKYSQGYLYTTGFIADSSTGTSSFFTAKLNAATGDTIFTRVYHGTFTAGDDVATNLLIDDTGNIYVCGTEQMSANDYRMTLIKYDNSGNIIWVSGYDSSGLYTGAMGMALNPGSDIVMTGYSGTAYSNYDFCTVWASIGNGGNILSVARTPGISLTSHPTGIITDVAQDVVILGTATTSSGSVIKLIEYDSAFTQVASQTFGDTNSVTVATGIANDGAAHLVVSGYAANTSGGKDMLVFCINNNQTYFNFAVDTVLWTKRLSAPDPTQENSAAAITTDNFGNAIATGRVFNGSKFVMNTVSLSISNGGAVQWQKTYNAGGSYDGGTAVFSDGNNNIYGLETSVNSANDTLYKMIEYAQWSPSSCKYSICPDIYYSFENARVTTSGTDTFAEFDIYATQNNTSLPFSGADIYFTYSNNVFGTNVVDSNTIAVTRGTITTNTNYVLTLTDTLLKSDAVPSNGGEVQLSIDAMEDTSNLFYIADTMQQLCHVKMKLKGYGDSEIGFDDFYMQNNSDFYSDVNIPYTFVYTDGSLGSLRSDGITYQVVFDSVSYSSGPETLIFDIQASSNAGDYLYDADPVIDFDTSSFGSNASIICSAGSSIGNDYTISVSDNSNSFTLLVNATGSYDLINDPSDATIISSTYISLATCAITVQNCCVAGASLSVDASSAGSYGSVVAGYWENDSTYVPASQTVAAYTVTDGSGYSNSGNLCSSSAPAITGLYPLTITAGTFSVLTITGSGFGCTQGTVLFPNADDGGSSMMKTQAPDIQDWGGSQIHVWVPSTETNATGKTAGSGQIQVITSTGDTSAFSGASLTIPYAVLNVRNSDENPIPVGLVSQNGTGGYTFTPDSSIGDTAIGTITQAMNDWICQTGVNFKMGPTAPNLTQNDTDGINAILFGTPDDGDLAQTYISFYPSICYGNGPGIAAIRDMDMVISSNALGGVWDYSNTTYPASGELTLLGTVRHEFGHACGLCEVLTASDLMFWEDPGAGAPAIPISHDDQNGGLYILTTVGPNIEAGCFPINQQSFPTGCPTLTIENGIANVVDNPFNIFIYPNPFGESITVQASLDQPAHVQVIMYDMLGQVVCSDNFGMQSGSVEKSISVSSLSVGMYIVRVITGGQSAQVKLIKK